MRETNWVRREKPGDRSTKTETLEEIAERIAYSEATSEPESLKADVLSALRNEREACAQVADEYQSFGNGYKRIRAEIAAAIRKGR